MNLAQAVPRGSNMEALLDNPNLVRSHVIAFFYGRSGSFLLTSLLDNHPQVLAAPPRGLLSFFATFIALLSTNPSLNEDSILEFVEREFPNLFRPRADKPALGKDHFGDHGVDLDSFRAAFKRGLRSLILRGNLSFAGLCSLIQVAYAYAQGRELGSERPIAIWQEHSPLSADQARFLAESLPDVRFLVSVRRPEKSFDSHLHHTHKEVCPPQVEKIFRNRLCNHFLIDGVAHPLLHERTRAVRFEDVHAHTESTMRAVVQWLSIDWHPCLMESTIDGKEFAFNSHGKNEEGTDPKKARDRNTKRLWLLDRLKIRFLLERHYLAWGYQIGRLQRLLRLGWLRALCFGIPSKFEIQVMLEELRQVYCKHREMHKATAQEALERHQRSREQSPIQLLSGTPDERY